MKLSKKELKKRKELAQKWQTVINSQHCKGWGKMPGTCPDTTQCANCFIVIEGPVDCLGCNAGFSSREERLKRKCPLLKRSEEA